MRVLNKKTDGVPEGAVYVGRPTKWGSPFPIVHKSGLVVREASVQRYRRWLWSRKDLLAQLGELEGKDLVCHCAPQLCHAEVLLRAVDWHSKQKAGF